MGDFNCKIGTHIKGNKEEIMKSGKMMMRLVEKEKLIILNTLERCQGLWTRVEKETRSVIDYMMVGEEDEANVKKVVIDERKEITPFRLLKKDGKANIIYSDHNAMMCNLSWREENRQKQHNSNRKIMTENSYKKYERKLEEIEVSKIWEKNEGMQKLYDEWVEIVAKVMEACKKKARNKNKSKTMRNMITTKRNLKKKLKTITNISDRKITMTRYKQLTNYAIEEQQKQYSKQIQATVENLRKVGGGMKEMTFWEFKRKLERRKEEQMTSMIDINGRIVETKEEILKVYEDFYTNLFELKKAKTDEEVAIEKNIIKKIDNIKEKARKQDTLQFNQEEIRKTIKGLKLRKAADGEGWRNEMIKNGGKEMEKSIVKMFNKILKEGTTPRQWENMKIKSIYKNKGSRKEVKNRRGIFITNIISKVFEKALINKAGHMVKMDQHQSGGKKEAMKSDNWMILRAIIDNNKRLGKNTYVIMADAEKCFDKLWLLDCLVDEKSRYVCMYVCRFTSFITTII